jgi:hypothetical protein
VKGSMSVGCNPACHRATQPRNDHSLQPTPPLAVNCICGLLLMTAAGRAILLLLPPLLRAALLMACTVPLLPAAAAGTGCHAVAYLAACCVTFLILFMIIFMFIFVFIFMVRSTAICIFFILR